MTTAVVLYNLGGPDKPADVRKFLFNLFNDPMIIGAPAPIRWTLAQMISRRRAPIARAIYANIGGGSPLLANTRAQAEALEVVLNSEPHGADAPGPFRCHVAMRYWHPFWHETMDAVIAQAPERIVLVPLYPQFSTTTVGSMMRVWNQAAEKRGLSIPVTALCCYPTEPGFVDAVAETLVEALAKVPDGVPARVLFSAHGLPKQVVEGGDPYQWQVEQTARAVIARLARDGTQVPDWLCSYQSRVGPLEWIRPSTDEEIERAGADKVALVIVPIAFVSEHSETLVELDIEYRHIAGRCGVPAFVRTPTVSTMPAFIDGLARLVRDRVARPCDICTGDPGAAGGRLCGGEWAKCPVPVSPGAAGGNGHG
jgi:ferrochelatase